MSKEWFQQIDKSKKWATFRERYLCPCCFMPTLSERAGYEICSICFWEDDGQDSDDADNIRGGPNADYSLSEARDNFKKYFTMYRPSDNPEDDKEQLEKEELYQAYIRALKSNDEKEWDIALSIEANYQ